eukprot:TRINITY_DN3440_c0_g1_i1.p1 TRINITY_DN3440_c0_g1~~TRINITY_DN3440_c0_g1_i1.p1  ORF type:complete len:870 (+),score=239.31 TRINITY_DN3440_c0_g1_i1:259-2868(+)
MSVLGETYESRKNKLGIINALRKKKDELDVKKKHKNKNAKHRRLRFEDFAHADAVRFSDLNDAKFSGESKIITWLKRKRSSSPNTGSPSPPSPQTPPSPSSSSHHHQTSRVRRKKNKLTRISSRPFYSPPRSILSSESIDNRRSKTIFPNSSLLGLPIELILNILLRLSPSQITIFAMLCSQSYYISKDSSIWKSLYYRTFPTPLCSSLLLYSDSSSSPSILTSPLSQHDTSTATLSVSSNTSASTSTATATSNSNCSTGSSHIDYSTSSSDLTYLHQNSNLNIDDWKDKFLNKVYRASEIEKDWLTSFSSCNNIINPNAVSVGTASSDNSTASASNSTNSCSTNTTPCGTPSSHNSSGSNSLSASSPGSFSFTNSHTTPLKANITNHSNHNDNFFDAGSFKTNTTSNNTTSTINSPSKDSSSSPSPNSPSVFFPPHQILDHNHKKDLDDNNKSNNYTGKEMKKELNEGYINNNNTPKDDLNLNIRKAPQINLLHTFKAHTGSISCVDFSKNLEILVSCAKDQTIRIASFPHPHYRGKFKVLKTLKPHTEKEISRVKIDESTIIPRLFSCASDRTTRIYDLGTLANIATLSGHDKKVWALDVYQNVAVTGGADSMIKIWDLRIGSNSHHSHNHNHNGNVGTIKIEGNKAITIYDIIYDDENKTIISANGHPDNTIRLFDIRKTLAASITTDSNSSSSNSNTNSNSNHALLTMKGHKNYVFKIKRVGNNLISGSGDGAIKIWDLQNGGECLKTLTRGGGGGMGGAGGRFGGAGGMVLGLDADKTKIVSAGSGGGKINVWDVSKGEIVNKWEAHKDTVWSLKVEEDLLVTGSDDSVVKVWRMTGGEEVERKARKEKGRRGRKILKELLGPY